MDAQVAPELAARRSERRERSSSSGVPKAPPASTTAAPGADGERPRPARRAVGDAGAALDAGRARVPSKRIAPGLDAGSHPGPGGDRARQVGDVHRPLRVEPAADRAGAALDAAPGVAAQRVRG